MSSRKGLVAQTRTPVDPIPEPNRHISLITADCRVYFPPNASRDQIVDTLTRACADLVKQIDAEPLPGPLNNVWLQPPRSDDDG